MGLNIKDIKLRLCRVIQVSAETSHTFLKRHPIISGALFVFFILYIFLSYIYSFLVYLSPFLVCAIIFVRIFWSSEQTHLRYVKREEEEKEEQKTVEPKFPKFPNYGRREVLYKYPSQNYAISRRRNFREKKWDVYGDLEEKAKDLSSVFHNEFIRRKTENKEAKGESFLDSTERFQVPQRQTLRSEPSMRDLVEVIETAKMEYGDDDDDDEEEAQEDRNKAIEWTEADQKNLTDLGISEMERNKRLENLIARRKERKQLTKMQIEKGPNIKSITPNQFAPLLIARGNKPLDSSDDFEGIDDLQMPGSAPSFLPRARSPFNIPYDPSEEKPNLMGESFDLQFTNLGAREPHPLFNNGRNVSDRFAYPRFRKLPDKGNQGWLTEQLNCKETGEIGFEAPSSLRKGEEKTYEEDGKCKADMAGMKKEEVQNAPATKSMSDYTTKQYLIPSISNVETARVSEKPRPRVPKPHEMILNFPVSPGTINVSHHDSVPSPVDKNQENMYFNDRRTCHTPTHSIASDLQVEVSEVGSPTSTIDENPENVTSDGEAVEYDGDIDRDVSSGSEDMWGASFNGRQGHGVTEEEIAEFNKSKDIASPLAIRQIIDEDNVADVSSLSPGSMPGDTPTYAINSDHNIFGYVKDSAWKTEAHQCSNSLDVPLPQKQLMDSSVDHLPHETHSEKPEEWGNMSENLINEAQVINYVNNLAATEQDNTENSRSNGDLGASFVRQESIDEFSGMSIASCSPRSVLPEKTTEDQVTSSAYIQQMHIDVPQSDMEDMAQETLNGEPPPDTLPQIVQPLMDDPTVETHNGDFNHSQTNTTENSIEESNIFGKMNDAEVCNKEEEEKLKNDDNSEDKSTPLIRQEGTTDTEDMNEKSRELVDDKVPSNSLMESSSEVHTENSDKSQTSMRQDATAEPPMNAEADLENHLQSESTEMVEDDMKKEKLDKGNISKDSPEPTVTEVNNSKSAKDTVGKSDELKKNEGTEQELNKNEATEQELNKNETMVAEGTNSKSAEDTAGKSKEVNKNEAKEKELNKNETMVIEETISKYAEDTVGKSNQLSMNEAIEQESNNNEAMVSFEPVRESDKESNTTHMKEPREVAQLEDANAPKP